MESNPGLLMCCKGTYEGFFLEKDKIWIVKPVRNQFLISLQIWNLEVNCSSMVQELSNLLKYSHHNERPKWGHFANPFPDPLVRDISPSSQPIFEKLTLTFALWQELSEMVFWP